MGSTESNTALAEAHRPARPWISEGMMILVALPSAAAWKASRALMRSTASLGSASLSSLGRGELLQGEVLDEDAIIAAYDAVTRADVQALAGELFRFENASLSAVGRVGSADAYRALLH